MQPESLKTASTEGHQLIQLIVFRSGKEEFGLPIHIVREIIKFGTITPIPDSPDFIKGIINVRGEIVTALDIKKLFNLAEEEESESKHIVVTKNDENLFGLIVDEVVEVLRVKPRDISSPPELVTKINNDYVSGVIVYNNRLIIILNMTPMLAQKKLVKLAQEIRDLENEKNKTNK